MYIHKKKGEEKTRRKKEKNRRRKKKREKALHLRQQQLCDPTGNVTQFCLSWKDPINVSAHQTADQVHEWHLSEPRVNPVIRGNLPKGLCSWEKCLLQRGMQKIPGSTGPPLLAVWRYSGANKGTKMGSQMQWTFEENVFQRPPWNIPLKKKKKNTPKSYYFDKDELQNVYPNHHFIVLHNLGDSQ